MESQAGLQYVSSMESDVHRPTEDELRVFSERIARRLADRPLDLDPGFHRERVAGLLRQAGEASFYQLLDLPPTSTAQEIHDAYEQIARLVHPVNAPLLGLTGREGVLEMLFEQITQAYLNLSHPERRKAYDRGMSSQAWSAALGPGPSQRRDEVRDLADRYHKRALELIAKDELYLAIEALREAVRISPQADLYALLGKLQAKNPRWLRAATESLQQAMALGSRDPDLPAALHDAQQRLDAGEWRAANPTTGASSRAARAGKWEDAPDVEVFDPEEEIGGRR
jgi:tetratricopeptide (TPR) repeat protein